MGYNIVEVFTVNVIESILVEERQRNLDMQKSYMDEINKLPKGTVVIKKIGNKEYCYLKYRRGDKFISQYMGHASEKAVLLKRQVEKRRYFEKLLRELKNEYKLICKVVKV